MGYIGAREPALIDAGSIDNSELAVVNTKTLKGRISSGTGSPEDLSADQAITLLNEASSSTLNAARLASHYRSVRVDGGANLTQRPRLNLISGSGVSLSGADDSGESESEITVALAPLAALRVLGNSSGAPATPSALDSDGLFAVLNGSGTAQLSNNRLAPLTPSPAGSYTRASITVDAQGRVTAATSGGSITNADITAGAEIAVSKLANGSARQLLQTASNGSDVEWTSNVDLPGTLDVTGTATFDGAVVCAGSGSLKLPAGTDGQRPGAPAAGMLRYNSTSSTFEGYSSGSWGPLVSYSAGSGISISGNSIGLAPLPQGQILIGNSLNAASARPLSGDVLINESGVTSIAAGVIDNADISAGAAIAHSKLAAMSPGTVLVGNALGVPTATVVSGDVLIHTTGQTVINPGVIDNADISAVAAIAHSKLAAMGAGQVLLGNVSGVPTATTISGDVTINSSGQTSIEAGVIRNADINLEAGIDHSKLAPITAGRVLMGNAGNVPTATALSGDVTINASGVCAIEPGVIVNADISASAEIAVTKLGNGSARQVVQTASNGSDVEWTSSLDLPGSLDVTGTATFDGAVVCAGTGSLKLPAGTDAQRPAGPISGMLRYNSTSNTFEGYYASTWAPLAGYTAGNGIAIGSGVIELGPITAGRVLMGNGSNVATATALSGDVTINASGVTAIEAGVIVNADINNNAAIAHTKLAAMSAGTVLLGNASNVPTATTLSGDIAVASNGVVTVTAGAIGNAEISNSAAIALNKLAAMGAGTVLLGNGSGTPTATALSGDVTINSSGVTAIGSGVIVDGDISASAEIAVSKLGNGTANQLLQTASNGTAVEWTSSIAISGSATAGSFIPSSSTPPALGMYTPSAGALGFMSGSNEIFSVYSGGAVVRAGVGAGESYLALASGTNAASIASGATLSSLHFTDRSGGIYATIRGVTTNGSNTNDYPGSLQFLTTDDGSASGLERFRINSKGRLLGYTTGASGARFNTSSGAGTSATVFELGYSATDVISGTLCLQVYSNGNVQNTNNSYGQISDSKLKENIVDAPSQWEDIKALKVRKFNFKEATGYQTHTQIGLVAQEVELVSPGLVSETPDRDAEGNELGTATKGVKYSVLYMKAVKALQEAIDRIEELEQRVSDLEGA